MFIHIFRELTIRLNGRETFAVEDGCCLVARIYSFSFAEIAFDSSGLFLNSRYQMMENRSPKQPKMTKVHLHPILVSIHATRGRAKAAPRREPEKLIPCMIPLSLTGNQLKTTLARLGKAPASPAPKRNLMTIMDTKFHAAPVKAVRTDQRATIVVMTVLGPLLSASFPEGV